MIVLFLHGWGARAGGRKPTFLRSRGLSVLNPELPDDDFEASRSIAQKALDEHGPAVVVGSSRGGAVTMNINTGAARLVLLCPAWKVFGSARTVKPETTILHSPHDCVVPLQASVELLVNSGLQRNSLIETGLDHRLADLDSLNVMLAAVRGSN
jgi:hypothetical protein